MRDRNSNYGKSMISLYEDRVRLFPQAIKELDQLGELKSRDTYAAYLKLDKAFLAAWEANPQRDHDELWLEIDPAGAR